AAGNAPHSRRTTHYRAHFDRARRPRRLRSGAHDRRYWSCAARCDTGGNARGCAQGAAWIWRANAACEPQICSDGDPVATGRGHKGASAHSQPAWPAEGDQGNARRRISCRALLHRLDRRALHRDARIRVQGVSAEERVAASGHMKPSAKPSSDSNQPPPFEGRNLYDTQPALREAVIREGAAWAQTRLEAWGALLGRAETFALADRANRCTPELKTHDRFGDRIDEVVFDPSWHELMALAIHEGEQATPWLEPRPGAQVARAAAYVMRAQVENGTQCPLTMTYAAVPVLRRYARALPWLESNWLPHIL